MPLRLAMNRLLTSLPMDPLHKLKAHDSFQMFWEISCISSDVTETSPSQRNGKSYEQEEVVIRKMYTKACRFKHLMKAK